MQTKSRLYVDAPLTLSASLMLDEKQSHYLAKVMRAKMGESLLLFNGKDGEWLAEISQISKRNVSVTLTEQTRKMTPAPKLIACIAPVKGKRLEGMIEKATELGAAIIQPVISARTIVRKVNVERLQLITQEAAEQSERLELPEIKPALTLTQLLSQWGANIPLIYGDESGAENTALSGLHEPAKAHGWGILTGPEGGFTPDEFAALTAAKSAYGICLGPRILRSETACTTLCAITMQQFGDWHSRPAFRSNPEPERHHAT